MDAAKLPSLQSRPDSPEVLKKIYDLFRDYFDRAEKKRRWNVRQDVPWDQCNPSLNPALADVVETFCTVEMYLPDYLSKLIPQVRANRGRAWFMANWGYEEAKHSMVLGDWLLKSGQRTEEQMADLETEVFSHEYTLVADNARGAVCYTMLQELATWLHYVNLRKIANGQDPALDRILSLVSIDERAHYNFFRKIVEIYLEYDRPGTLEQLRNMVNCFQMPAIDLLVDSKKRMNEVRELRIFDADIFVYQVLNPILAELKVDRKELRKRQSSREIVVLNHNPA